MIYLDNNATTQIAKEVFREMLPYLNEKYANPSSAHRFGMEVAKKLDEARERVADFLGAEDPSEVLFTSGGTESNNAAIRGVLEALPNRRHLITTQAEHPSILETVDELERKGYRVTRLPVNREGELEPGELEDLISEEIALVSVMAANNETGVIFPVDQIARIVKRRNVLLHVDAVQAVGKVPTDVRASGIDLLSLSGHKLHGPKGIGALYVRKKTPWKRWMFGGHQEGNRRGGTENVASAIGLGKACELASVFLKEERSRLQGLRDRLEQELLRRIPGVSVIGASKNRVPQTTHLSFDGVEGEALMMALSEEGIYVSTGAACTAGSLDPSHVLLAMGLSEEQARSAVRFSLSRYTTEDEIDQTLRAVETLVARLRAILVD